MQSNKTGTHCGQWFIATAILVMKAAAIRTTRTVNIMADSLKAGSIQRAVADVCTSTHGWSIT